MTIDERHHREQLTSEQRRAENEAIKAAAEKRIRASIDRCSCPPGHPAHERSLP